MIRTVLVFSAATVLVAGPLSAQGAMRSAPSGRATTEVALTFADEAAARAAGKPSVIRIDYGQPHLRGRTLHNAQLVPYDTPWRLGANDATTLSTDVDLVIGGQPVPKGKYVLQALPSKNGWKLFVQKTDASAMQAAMAYKPENDIARIDLRVSTLAAPVESLTMWLIPGANGAASGELRFAWGTSQLSTDWAVKQN